MAITRTLVVLAALAAAADAAGLRAYLKGTGSCSGAACGTKAKTACGSALTHCQLDRACRPVLRCLPGRTTANPLAGVRTMAKILPCFTRQSSPDASTLEFGLCLARSLPEGSVKPPPPTTNKCTAGKFKYKTRNYCYSCPKGRYNYYKSRTYCSACPKGKTTAKVASTNARQCTLSTAKGGVCPKGATKYVRGAACYCYVTVKGSRKYSRCVRGGSKVTCVAGKYRSRVSNTCFNCPTGRYGYLKGRTNVRQCTRCPRGKTSLAGSNSRTKCSSAGATGCKKGYTKRTYGTRCYCRSPRGGFSRCQKIGTITTTCKKGTFKASNSANCLSCPKGRYGRKSGLRAINQCSRCPRGRSTPRVGATSVKQCDNWRKRPSRFCPSRTRTGFSTLAAAEKACQGSSRCLGVYLPTCHPTSKITSGAKKGQTQTNQYYACLKPAKGSWLTNSRMGSCVFEKPTHNQICPKGKYGTSRRRMAAIRSGQISVYMTNAKGQCGEAHFPKTWAAQAIAYCTKPGHPGYSGTASCRNVKVGTCAGAGYKRKIGGKNGKTTLSVPGPAGAVALQIQLYKRGRASPPPPTSKFCFGCPIGRYSARKGIHSVTQCTQCATGRTTRRTSSSNKARCVTKVAVRCKVGKYQYRKGSSYCRTCPKGKTSAAGSKKLSSCKKGTDGRSYTKHLSEHCARNELAGKQYTSLYRAELACSTYGAARCSGVYDSGCNGVKSKADTYRLCQAGKKFATSAIGSCVYEAGGKAVTRGCRAGKYKSTTSNYCYNCPQGKFSAKGSLSLSQCMCRKGYTGSISCARCAAGTYKPTVGAQSCTSCPTGTTSRRSGMSSVKQCGRKATQCPGGKYKHAGGSSYCYTCPKGKHSSKGSVGVSACTTWDRHKNKHCAGAELAGSYTTLNQAEAACSNNLQCAGVYDSGCNSIGTYHICKKGTAFQRSIGGSCVYTSAAQCVSFTPTRGCKGHGAQVPRKKRNCRHRVAAGQSGVCDCGTHKVYADCAVKGKVGRSWHTCAGACAEAVKLSTGTIHN